MVDNMNHDHSQTSSIAQSVLAVPLAIVVWVVVHVLGYLALGLLDIVRGLDNDWLQRIFRELFTPGVGGYAALYAVHSWLSSANLKFVFRVFCLTVFLFTIGLPVFMTFFLPEGWTSSWGEQIILSLGGAASILGAWLAYKHISRAAHLIRSSQLER
jgi:hypothetical protein